MQKEWKFKLGDSVTPIVHHGYEHATKMVVVCRLAEEYQDYVELWYVCSHYKLGEYVHQRIAEAELETWTKEVL